MKKVTIKIFILIWVLAVSTTDLSAQTRIRFARGRTSATVTGSLVGGDERGYVLSARSGQYLSANVSSRNGCVVLGNGTTSLSFTTSSGNNYVYVSNGCGGTTSYNLTVSINY